MDDRHATAAGSDSINNSHTATADSGPGATRDATTGASPASPPARSQRVCPSSRKWSFGKEPRPRNASVSSREPVMLRDSVRYPTDSTFEDTVEKGTAQTGRRQAAKPQLVNLGHLRRKVRSMRQSMSHRSSTTLAVEKTASPQSQAPEVHRHSVHNIPYQPTIRQAATEMYHDTHIELARMTRTEYQSPSPRVPPMEFRDKIPGRHFSKDDGNLQDECKCYRKAWGTRAKRSGCVML
ncbi:hypothetical protein GGR54DRAFT_221659 [Hypoxylon sp. NC1633]|nr:hypothetical protein GGR54DRAFT_221659 [Hypoxylon sp. NC1633]